MSDDFISPSIKLQYYKALVAQLQWELDERNKLLTEYESLVKNALDGLKKLTMEVHHASY